MDSSGDSGTVTGVTIVEPMESNQQIENWLVHGYRHAAFMAPDAFPVFPLPGARPVSLVGCTLKHADAFASCARFPNRRHSAT
jgi:hypothetical protein